MINVLLADDHAVVRDGLRLLLEAHKDIRVVGDAANGCQAIYGVQELCPDVVVMDIAMPVMNGIDATKRIRTESPDTRVVILSMYATSEHIFRALQAGAHGYLLKESAGQEVVEAVKIVYAGERYLSPRIATTLIDDYVHQRELIKTTSPLEDLSPRERQILQMVVEGGSSSEIGAALGLSSKTVATYRSRLMRKLGVSDIPGLVKFAIQHGLTPLSR